MMDSSTHQFIVRYRDSYALKFDGRIATTAVDKEAIHFDSPADAAAAVRQAGLDVRAVDIETVGADGGKFRDHTPKRKDAICD